MKRVRDKNMGLGGRVSANSDKHGFSGFFLFGKEIVYRKVQ